MSPLDQAMMDDAAVRLRIQLQSANLLLQLKLIKKYQTALETIAASDCATTSPIAAEALKTDSPKPETPKLPGAGGLPSPFVLLAFFAVNFSSFLILNS